MSSHEMMRAAVYGAYGGPDVVGVHAIPRPRPRAGEVLVRIHASTVSAGDSRMRSLTVPRGFGLLARLAIGVFGPRKHVLGTELAGVVDALGAGVTSFAVGERVVAFVGAGMGCHAEYRTVPEKGIVRLPDALSFEQGAALAFGGCTALHFLRAAKTGPADKVLVIGASGAVGSAAVQLGKHLGAVVTGVTSTANVEQVRTLGADQVIDYARERPLAGSARYDVIVEAVGASSYKACRPVLADGGRLVLCAGSLPQILGGLLRTMGTSRRVLAGPAPERPEDLATLVELAATGRFTPLIDRTFALARISEAHAYVDTGRKRGSVVVTM